ncbi:hypothetical protein HJC23_004466 [Cyclotella cryptica]|uniref:RNA polymerase sigma-70 domain-containing protein n=1 Tax=Cyclotella cryptica TaxID=29204 RepID=A0ABD3QEY1_9STRA|eukprot:CCRYP_006085-RA/>CCRYP_006085-RA protein AED:0.00 eAED:0.00 QI:295/-1/1/1/-1/1/1/99/527
MSSALPQHVMNARSELSLKLKSRSLVRQRTTLLGLAVLLSPHRSVDALSVSAPPRRTTPKKLYEARLQNDLKNDSLQSRRNALLTSATPSLDNDAWLAALFDDAADDAVDSSAKSRAEEFDRFMEVSSIVKDNLAPGSLVNEVKHAKGADVDAELLLQTNAVAKRRAAVASLQESPASSAILSQVTASSPLSNGDPSARSKRGQRVNPLLSKEHEYALARAIQLGVRVHKIKAEFESHNDRPLSKREWAALAGLDGPNELRRVVSEYRNAKQELVSSNMGLVHAVARDFQRKAYYRGLTLEELVQEGSMGLIRAAELFDPEKGLRFSTYATIWIKGALQNQRLDEFVKLPPLEKKAWNDIKGVLRDLEADQTDAKGSKKISTKLIADRLGMDPSKVDANIKRMTSVSKVLSLDYQYTSTTRSGHADGKKQHEVFMADKHSTDADLAERAQLKADIVTGLISNLNEQEILLIRLVYGLYDGKEYTIKDSAEIMGLNKETTRLLHKACLKKLREASNMESLQEYLLTVA